MEGVLVTLLRARGLDPTPERYLAMLQELGWKPRVTFRKLVAEMARADLREAERDQLVSQRRL